MLYANVTEADILLRDELLALQRAHPHVFKVVHTLDDPPLLPLVRCEGVHQSQAHQGARPVCRKGDKVKVLICGTS